MLSSCTTGVEAYDVIIVGAGPAGLMCAAWLALRGVKVKILEKRHARPLRGRADGLEPRTLEILKSFGLLDSWWRKANRTVELSVWLTYVPVSSHNRKLERVMRRCNSARGSSRFYEATMDQAVIELAIEEHLAREYGIFVQYSTECLNLQVEETTGEHSVVDLPITLTIAGKQPGFTENAAPASTTTTFKAKYLVGADGSRSWTRNQVGINMLGAQTTHYWGVADIVPMSDFPDIRNRCIIHNEKSGTVMIIPREDGMVRLYVQLGEAVSTASSGLQFSPSHTILTAQNIIRPFKLDYNHIYWSSCYRVQQKLATSFSAFDRIFLIGDAIHTHSPKAGQGLNVSIQDAYNLGWKLAAVVNGEARPALLSTYEDDRRPIAKFLVEFDNNFQRFFHEPLAATNWSAEDYSAALCEAINVEHVELSGISACFKDAHMLEDPQYVQEELALRVPIGRRVPDVFIANQADGRGWYLHDLLYNNGHWRLLIFPGDLRDEMLMRRYMNLGRDLCSIGSPLNEFASGPKNAEVLVDVFTIHASPRHDIDLLQLPEVFHPWNDGRGWDYHKVFVDDETYHEGRGYAYETLGICPYRGCALLLRPDQHVCMIMDNENAARASTRYLSNWLYKRSKSTNDSRR